MEVYVNDEAKLTLHGLQQHYVKLKENEKNKKLFELLDVLEFNQVRIKKKKKKSNASVLSHDTCNITRTFSFWCHFIRVFIPSDICSLLPANYNYIIYNFPNQ
jgi:hypothetical protein